MGSKRTSAARRAVLRALQMGCALALLTACAGEDDDAEAPGAGTGGDRDGGSFRAPDGGDAARADSAAPGCEAPPPGEDLGPAPSGFEARAIAAPVHRYFGIRVVDADSGEPLAGARLETTYRSVHVSDANGAVAFYEPGLMGRGDSFSASYPGYEAPEDALGIRGVRLVASEGESGEIALARVGSAPPPEVSSDLESRLLAGPVPGPDACFAIRVVDAAIGRGVPLVRLRAAGEELWSDSQGYVAYCNPDGLGSQLEFEVWSHGYHRAAGPLVRLDVRAGQSAEIELARDNVAERLYRVTGIGIYRDSVLLGRSTPIEQPLVNGLVAGQDTVQATVYDGALFWLWATPIARAIRSATSARPERARASPRGCRPSTASICATSWTIRASRARWRRQRPFPETVASPGSGA